MTRPVEITHEYVKGLSDSLITYTTEPIDTMTVLALAVQAALWEAWEQIHHGETHLRMFPHGIGVGVSHGEIMAAKRIIRQVADALRLMRPGPDSTPGERILAARTARYHTHTSLGYAIGVDRAHVSRVERGKRTLTPDVAQRMAAVLGVTAEYLLTGKDPDATDHHL